MGKRCDHPDQRVVRLKGSKVRRQCTACGRHFKWEKFKEAEVVALSARMDKGRREKHKDGRSVKVKRHDMARRRPAPDIDIVPTVLEIAPNPDDGSLAKDPTLAFPHVPTRVELQAMTIASLKLTYPYLCSMPSKSKKDEIVQRVIDTETQVVNA